MAVKMRRKNVAILVAKTDINYQTPILNAICGRLNEFNCNAAIFQSFPYDDSHTDGTVNNTYNRWQNHIFSLVNTEKFDGMIVLSQTFSRQNGAELPIIADALSKRIPVVSLDGEYNGCFNILQDDGGAIENITRHLIDVHGIRRTIFIDGSPDGSILPQRRRGYSKALTDSGIEVTDENFICGYLWMGGAAKAVEEYMASGKPLPEAFVCCNDVMAIAVSGLLTDRGIKVPEDVAVTGFDGLFESLYNVPSITTGTIVVSGSGTAAVDTLVEIMAGLAPATGTKLMPSETLLRSSCGCHDCGEADITLALRKLYIFDQREMLTSHMTRMMEQLTGASSLTETLDYITDYLARMLSNDVYLCLCDNCFTNYSGSSGDFSQEERTKPMPYSEDMQLASWIRDGQVMPKSEFGIMEILPKFEDAMDRNGSMMFIPLHHRARTFGYLAMHYNPQMAHDHFYPLLTFSSNISNALEIVVRQSELRIITQKMEYLYIHDPLTGLLNRRGFYQQANKLYKRCLDEGRGVSVFSIDIDDLKEINDKFGHSEGDTVIITLSGALVSAARNNEICTRFGGDEFIVLAMGDDENEAREYLSRIDDRVNDFNAGGILPYRLKFSCGVFRTTPTPDMSLDEMLKSADNLLYKDKRSHKLFRKSERD